MKQYTTPTLVANGDVIRATLSGGTKTNQENSSFRNFNGGEVGFYL